LDVVNDLGDIDQMSVGCYVSVHGQCFMTVEFLLDSWLYHYITPSFD
jgi:hypothetical protein